MPVRVGFIGSGGIASAHMNALQAIDDARIVAIADINTDQIGRAYKNTLNAFIYHFTYYPPHKVFY
jgi:predicted dehydrogenase